MTYVAEIPHGLGINIDPAIEKLAASSFVWRMFQQPSYWTDGGYGNRGMDGYIPSLPLCEWSEEFDTLGKTRKPNEFWLAGKDCQEVTHPTEAANFSNEWMLSVNGLTCLPGVRVGVEGLKWMDEYLDVGGLVPDAWHIHITAPWDEFVKDYGLFLAWMRRRSVLRPVVVTDVESGAEKRPTHAEFVKKMVEGLSRQNFLSALVWSTVYDPQRWGASMVMYSMQLTSLGKLWVAAQKEWRDALSSHSSRPAWDLLGIRDRDSNTGTQRGSANGKDNARASHQRNVR